MQFFWRNRQADSLLLGQRVGIGWHGGLGHLAVQYAKKAGYEVAAISRRADKEPLARQLGAHHYIDSEKENPAEALKALGSATFQHFNRRASYD